MLYLNRACLGVIVVMGIGREGGKEESNVLTVMDSAEVWLNGGSV